MNCACLWIDHLAVVAAEHRKIIDDQSTNRIAGRGLIDQRRRELLEPEMLEYTERTLRVADRIAQSGPRTVAVDPYHCYDLPTSVTLPSAPHAPELISQYVMNLSMGVRGASM